MVGWGHQPLGVADGPPDFVLNPPVECVVFGWGANEDGQLGLDRDTVVSVPRVIESLLGSRLRGRDGIRCPLVGGSRVSLAICADGRMWSWGWNERGTIGNGQRGGERKPKKVAALRGVKIVQAAVGGWHCLAVTEDRKVYAWGGNEYLQCGVDGEDKNIVSPTICVPHLKVMQVACGGMHSLALTANGEVWTWGEPWGEFKLEKEKNPRPVQGATNIQQIACGAFHNMALDQNGRVLTWGTNDYGQLGNGGTSYQKTPQQVVDLDDIEVSDVVAGGWHSIALSKHGELFIWGRGEYGRLGLGDKSGASRLRPQKLKSLEGHCIIQAAAGGTHTMCLTVESRIFIWGRGSFGRLGTGDTRNAFLPCEVTLPGGRHRWKVIAISCGGRHSLCLALPMNTERSSSGAISGIECGSEGDDEGSSSENGKGIKTPAVSTMGEEDNLLSPQGEDVGGGYELTALKASPFELVGAQRQLDAMEDQNLGPADFPESACEISGSSIEEESGDAWMRPPMESDGWLNEPVSEELGSPSNIPIRDSIRGCVQLGHGDFLGGSEFNRHESVETD